MQTEVQKCRTIQNFHNFFCNTYKLELPKGLYICLIFIVADLYEFCEGEKSDEAGTPNEWKKQLPVKAVEEVEEILATRVGKKTHQR